MLRVMGAPYGGAKPIGLMFVGMARQSLPN